MGSTKKMGRRIALFTLLGLIIGFVLVMSTNALADLEETGIIVNTPEETTPASDQPDQSEEEQEPAIQTEELTEESTEETLEETLDSDLDGLAKVIALNGMQKLKSGMTGEEKKLSSDLLKLVNGKYLTGGQSRKELVQEMQERNQFRPASAGYDGAEGKRSGERVYVYIYLKENVDISYADSFLAAVTDRDPDNHLLAAWVEVSQLASLASQEGVRTIKTVQPPRINAGAAETEGVVIERAGQVLGRFGQDGAGIKVGVISDGADHWTDARNSGDLPDNVQVLRNGSGDEGTAMLEIIHDMAPGAELYFYESGDNTIAFNHAIDELVAAGCRVIVDDIGWLTEPFFEDGLVARHVADVLDGNNVIYVSAAGNSASTHYQGEYCGDQNNLHDFSGDGSGDESLYAYLPPGAGILIILEWNDRFGASRNDYDLYLLDGSSQIIGWSTGYQDGDDDPLEGFLYINDTGSAIDGEIVVENREGEAATRILELYAYPDGGGYLYPDNLTPGDSIFGQPAVPGVIAVGAVDQAHPSSIEDFSSRGPVTIRYPSSFTRKKPDLVAVDDVSITGAGGFSNPFQGTSASAPHVAAIAALLWAQFPDKSGDQISSIISNTAVDLGSAGRDNIYGYGRADAMNAFMAEMANYVFPAGTAKRGGMPVAIANSGNAANEVWFAPAGTTNFGEGPKMTKASGDATSIMAPADSGTYQLYLLVDSVASSPSKAVLTVDLLAPANQNTVFSASQTKKGGAMVSIASSGDAANEVWFAPEGTTNFLAGPTMTRAADGTATTMAAPETEGIYRLYLIDAAGNVSLPSTAVLTVDNTPPSNQDRVFSAGTVVKGDTTVTIASSGDAANSVWFAPAGTASFIAGPTMTRAANGAALTIKSPQNEGEYKLYLIDIVGNVSLPSGATLTVDNTAPTCQDTVFPNSLTKRGGTLISIASSGDPANSVWFAPAQTKNFVQGSRMTKAAGDATTIYTPDLPGNYGLYVIDAAGNVSAPSTAILTVNIAAPTIQNTVFPSSVVTRGGATVTIAGSGDATNQVWFAPSGTIEFILGPAMTKAADGLATVIAAPENEGEYRLFVIDARGDVTPPSLAALTVDNTVPAFADTYPKESAVGGRCARLAIKANESGTAYYAVLPAGENAPTGAQVKAGADASGQTLAENRKGQVSLTAQAEVSVTITGLTEMTPYVFYAVLEDKAENLQEHPGEAGFQTVAVGTDAALAGIYLSSGVLTPAFDAARTDYTADVSNSTSRITVTALTEHPGAAVTLNGHGPESPVDLAVGANTIVILVTAEDGLTAKTYTLTVTRARGGGGGGGGGSDSAVSPSVETAEDLPPLADDKFAESIKKTGEAILSLSDYQNGKLRLTPALVRQLREKQKTLTLTNNGLTIKFASGSLITPELTAGLRSADTFLELGAREADAEEKYEILAGAKAGQSTGLFKIEGQMVELSAEMVRGDSREKIRKFSEPVAVTIDLSDIRLDQDEIARLTGVRFEKSADGSIRLVKLGGSYDAAARTFTFYADEFSFYGVLRARELNQITLSIDNYFLDINGKTKMMDVPPVIIDGRTMIPLRFVVENMGAGVDWDAGTKRVTIGLNEESLTMVVGETGPGLDVPPVVQEGRILVPIRYVSESLKAEVLWFPDTKTVQIVQ